MMLLEKEPCVSVIIPSYGGSDSLKLAIDSLLLQEYENMEIIVVDDNDPETEARRKTERLMSCYAKEKKVIYLQHEHNKNGSAARNTGYGKSTGAYIVFLDDDDLCLPGRIRKQVDYLEVEKDYGGCYCWTRKKDKDYCVSLTGDLSRELLGMSFSAATSTLMFRREAVEALKGFDESFVRHQDYEFLLRFYKHFKLGVVKEVLVERPYNEINNMVKGEKLYQVKCHFFEKFEDDINRLDKEEPGFRKYVYAVHYSYVWKEAIRHGQVGLLWKSYWNYGRYGGIEFWNLLIKRFYCGITRKNFRNTYLQKGKAYV